LLELILCTQVSRNEAIIDVGCGGASVLVDHHLLIVVKHFLNEPYYDLVEFTIFICLVTQEGGNWLGKSLIK
jgi:hypothetical protein